MQSLTVDLERRFGGLARLYGSDGAQRIRSAHIVVVGIGGVGSWAAEAVARSGVARLTLIDLDHIAESNINRQVHALDATLGQAKVQAMRERISQINPYCQVECIEEFVDAANWPEILSLKNTFNMGVIDACDQVKAKTAMAAWSVKNQVDLISVGAAGGKRMAHCVDIEDLAAVTHDPLLAQMRYRLRKEHGAAAKGKIGVACVFSREPVSKSANLEGVIVKGMETAIIDGTQIDVDEVVQTDGSLNCHGYGSVVSVTASFGFCAAGWLIGKLADGGKMSKK